MALLAMGLLGGTALLLLGLDRMAGALRRMAGSRLRQTLLRFTRKPLPAFLTGIAVTAFTQSSTAITVMVVGLSAAGMLKLAQSIPIILGANIGTTITAQLIAFKLADYALLPVALGYAASRLRRWPQLQLWGEAVLGTGLVFLGLHTLILSLQPLRDAPAVLDTLARMQSPLLGFLAGLLLAALVHSSSAVIGVALALCSQGLLSLPAGIALSLGAEVGTCATALLASLGRGAEARRVALAHLLFNATSALLTLPLIDQLAAVAGQLSGSLARQLAHALTLFNCFWALLFLGLTAPLASLVQRLVPEQAEAEQTLLPARFLNPDYLAEADLAFTMVRREVARAGRRIQPLFDSLAILLSRLGVDEAAQIKQLQAAVSEHYEDLTAYLGRISLHELPSEHAADFLGLLRAANGLHHIMHLISNLADDLAEEESTLDPRVVEYSTPFHQTVSRALGLAVQALEQQDLRAAANVSAMKDEVNGQLRELRLGAAAYLAAAAARSGPAGPRGQEEGFEQVYAQLMNLLEHYKRIYYFARRSARTVLRPDDEEHD